MYLLFFKIYDKRSLAYRERYPLWLTVRFSVL